MSTRLRIRILFIALSFVIFGSVLYSQNSSESLYKQTKSLYIKALDAGGSVFAKSDFEKAYDLLVDAEDMIKKNDKPEYITEALNEANGLFGKTLDIANLMNVNFPDLMKTRRLVLAHPLTEEVLKIWNNAEEDFSYAAEDFNDKDMEGVKKYSESAAKLYKDAELIAVNEHYLGGIRKAIADAEDNDLETYAPLTLKKSKQLAADAEGILNGNRYDTLKAKEVIKTALYEINHGNYMRDLFKKMNDEKKSWEDLQLMGEEPLAKIASEFKLSPYFDAGTDNITSQILQNINSQRAKLGDAEKENQKLRANLAELEKTIGEYKTALADSKLSIEQLNGELEGMRKTNDTLKKTAEDLQIRMGVIENENAQFRSDSETLERNKKLIESISSLFLPSEAEVIRNGDLIIIRLINLNFPSGKVALEPQYFSLLNKVQKAIQTFPNGTVVIEGHTDGVGDYQKNLELSQGRATSVYQYLLSTMGADAGRISSVGLGSSKPIANNSSEEGRAKNRRIEVVINPNLTANK